MSSRPNLLGSQRLYWALLRLNKHTFNYFLYYYYLNEFMFCFILVRVLYNARRDVHDNTIIVSDACKRRTLYSVKKAAVLQVSDDWQPFCR
jgi:hypothetical protein